MQLYEPWPTAQEVDYLLVPLGMRANDRRVRNPSGELQSAHVEADGLRERACPNAEVAWMNEGVGDGAVEVQPKRKGGIWGDRHALDLRHRGLVAKEIEGEGVVSRRVGSARRIQGGGLGGVVVDTQLTGQGWGAVRSGEGELAALVGCHDLEGRKEGGGVRVSAPSCVRAEETLGAATKACVVAIDQPVAVVVDPVATNLGP